MARFEAQHFEPIEGPPTPGGVPPPNNTRTTAEQAPFRATIQLDIWAWQRHDAANILEQLVAKLENESTELHGGHSTHHSIRATELRMA